MATPKVTHTINISPEDNLRVEKLQRDIKKLSHSDIYRAGLEKVEENQKKAENC